ncbi:DUF350 domain-containing protein [Sporomusa malonica]|uniref:Putative membrane protein n=1 Tax=Sporomusa malonica TaxID=112901 RepID=A0A1W1ZQB5_9FIRM|nr:DUF350 domain-containing protein [Sporomusa malonica]SMC50402.1 putative membrane protein [Sporomusa malonica]
MGGQWENITNFLLYLGVALPLLGLGILAFMVITPYKEFQLIGEGDDIHEPARVASAQAAAVTLGGKILGLSLVLASAIFHSVNLVDLAIWGLVGIVFQIIIFYLYELVTPFKVVNEIPRGNIAVGILSAFLSISTGVLMAALISY